MSTKKKQQGAVNARRRYRQLLLSGYEHLAQPRDRDSDSQKDSKAQDSSPDITKGQRVYKVSVSLIVEQVSDDSGQYVYKVLLYDDANISVAPYSLRSKKQTGQAVDLPAKGFKGGDSFSVVYGIYESGMRALSHTLEHPIQRVVPQVYSWILGAIDRAIECTILIPENQAGDDDTGKCTESAPTSESLGTNKKTRRSKEIRAEILPETLPEASSNLVEVDGKILGGRQADDALRSDRVGSRAVQHGTIADSLGDGQSPDLGF